MRPWHCLVALLMCHHLAADPVDAIMAQYQPLFATFSDELKRNKIEFQSDPDRYWRWMSGIFVPLWSKQESLLQLSSADRLNELTAAQTERLNRVLEATMQRYAFEILDAYSGQQFVIKKIEYDNKLPRYATLVVTAMWDNFPDLDIDLMLVDDGVRWRFYNIKYGWFSYIGTKKWSYRRGLQGTRFDNFMVMLMKKNQKHFDTMCEQQALQNSVLCQDWQRHAILE